MGFKDRLLGKTSDLTTTPVAPSPDATEVAPAAPSLPPAAVSDSARFPPALPGSAPRTGPGQMLQFRGQMLAVEGELSKLRERLRQHEGALPARKLDTALVVPSRWANRHKDSFSNAEFVRLKQDIELSGGNVQPILVRVLPDQSERFEVVFGHRRHRACAELGLPVLAVIETGAMSDLELFAAMDRENRERADLAPYEQGVMYRRALDEKLYPSNRRLAEALGVSHTWVANVLSVADLPPPVIECFRSPLEIQHRHAKALSAALEGDRKGVLKRAEKLRQQATPRASGAVVEALIGAERPKRSERRGVMQAKGRAIGHWSVDDSGALNLQIQPGLVDPATVASVMQSVADLVIAQAGG